MIEEAGKIIETVQQNGSPFLLLGRKGGGLQELDYKEQCNLKRRGKRLQEAGKVEFLHPDGSGNLKDNLNDFIRLHQTRWEKKGEKGCFHNDPFRAFHKEISEIASQKGWLFLEFLSLNGERIAGIYGFQYGETAFFYLPGLNPDRMPNTSPGKLLLFESIRRAEEKGVLEYDLLKGTYDYKLAWATGIRRALTLRIFNRTFRAVFLKTLESAKTLIKLGVR